MVSPARAGSRRRRTASAGSNRRRTGPGRARRAEGGARPPALEQLDDGRVEADGDRAGNLEDERAPGRAGGASAPRARSGATAVHPEVRPELQPVVEADQQVLAVRLDREHVRADDAVHPRTRDASPGGEQRPPDQVRAQPGRRPGERVTLGHADVRPAWRPATRSTIPR